MPLIIMCGFPCSGKSKRANELKSYFEKSKGKTVHMSSDDSISFERNTTYSGKLHVIVFTCTCKTEFV